MKKHPPEVYGRNAAWLLPTNIGMSPPIATLAALQLRIHLYLEA